MTRVDPKSSEARPPITRRNPPRSSSASSKRSSARTGATPAAVKDGQLSSNEQLAANGATRDATAAIAFDNAIKRYPNQSAPALAIGGLKIEQGEIFGLLGPNGAGKTTCVGLCTTRVKATSGKVTINGVDVASNPALVKRQIGLVTQSICLDGTLSVSENLYLHCRYFAMPNRLARATTERLLDAFGLRDRAHSMPSELSGGLAQRVQIARAISHGPRVLFLDEPTAGLDPQSRLGLWEVIKSCRSAGATVFLSTHYLEEADALCDRVAILNHGQVLTCDSPQALRRKYPTETPVEIEVVRNSDRLRRRLDRLPNVGRVETLGTRLRVYLMGANASIREVVEAALPYEMQRITVEEPSLESIFIQLTGEDACD